MSRQAPASAATGTAPRLTAFVLERFPFAITLVRDVLASAGASRIRERDAAHIESFRVAFRQELKRALDAPVRILGALDTPVPYSPPLEEFFLPSEEEVEHAARVLIAY